MTSVPGTPDALSDLSVEVERKPGSQVVMRVEAPAHELEKAIDVALRRLARQLRIPGFRPGKAPAAVVERTVGWESVRREAVDDLLPTVYGKALDQADIDPVGEPSIDIDIAKIERGQPVKFSATVIIKPDVELGDYQAIRVDEPTTEVSDAQVDEALNGVRRRHSTLADVERAAQLGDVLRCHLKMTRGEEVLSGASDEERDLEVDPERLLPGLAQSLVGLSAGESKSFPITLPEDFEREELRGATVNVDATVSAVRERVLPPLDGALATLDEHGETLEELRAFYRDGLVAQAEREMTEQFENDVLSALRDGANVDVPELMVNAEIDRQLRELEYRMTSMGISWEQYLTYSGETVDKLRGERRESAAQRVKLELALDTLAETEGIEIDEASVVREEKRMAEGRKLTNEQKRRVHAAAHVDLRRQGAAQRMLEIARGEE